MKAKMKRMVTVGAALVCSALAWHVAIGGEQPSRASQRMRLGCQMWGVKDFWEKDPEKGFAEVFPKLRDMGYEGVQSMAFWKIAPDRLEALLKTNGLALADMPVNFSHVDGTNMESTVAFCRRFGVDFVYIPWFEGNTADEWRAFCARLADAGRRLEPYGIRIGYHNHVHEFTKPLQGEYPADILKADRNVNLELDIGPVTESGNDAPTWIAALSGRIPGMHAKPHGATAAGAPGDVQDWPKIVAAARKAGVKWFVVECEKRKDTYDDVAASAAFLKPLLDRDAAAGCLPPPVQARAEVKWVRPICVEPGRYIGWPSVCRLKNGDVIAVFSGDRDWHICPYGKVQLVRSADDGETWSAPETIADGPVDDRDAGVVQLPDGEILVVYFTSVAYRNPKILAKFPEYGKFDERLTDDVRAGALGNFAVRSRDNGKTWTKPERLALVGQTPHGPILLQDGSLFQIGRSFSESKIGAGEEGRTLISAERSDDGGRTWQMLCPSIPDSNGENAKPHMFHEPHVVELADGTLVGLVRYHGTDGCMRQTVSKDGGRTWTPMAKTSMVGLPPHLLRLADGKLVCVYGRRVPKPGFGEFAAISDDGGATWDTANEICLAPSLNGGPDLGYPASCVLSNGDILTVYYQQPKSGHKPCLMATRWRCKQ